MNKIQISRPSKKGISVQIDKTHKDEIHLNTISGRTFDSSPSFILKINAFSYYFNFPEAQQKNLMVKYYRNYDSPRNIFITSLYPDSVGGLPLFLLQNLSNFSKKYFITGPKEINKVLLIDPDYFGQKISQLNLKITDSYEDRFIKSVSLNLSQSISYDILLKNANQRLLVLDCRTVDDLKLLPNPSDFNVIVHLTVPEIFLKNEYTSFFTSHVSNESEKQKEQSQLPLNICFMPSGMITNNQSQKYYNERTKGFLQPLSIGKTLKPPPGFINFTSKSSSYDFIKKKITVDDEGEVIEIAFDGSDSNTHLNILSQLIEFEPTLPNFEKYAVTFLGSGTKHVSTKMSLSGCLIHTKYGFVVFDPSEGFFNQLKRKFGPKTTEYILKNIECIWISHYHQDHILGSPSLLYERSKVTDKQINFFAPQKFIDDIKNISELYGDFHVIYNNRETEESKISTPATTNSDTNKNSNDTRSYYDKYKTSNFGQNIKEMYSSIPSLFKINDHLSLQSIDVSHCNYTKGCLLLIDNESCIAFSGDHGYQKDYFADVFKNCDLLIHEATFPVYVRESIGDIVNHCYIDEAVETVKSMNPRIACLTHFSQRYNKEELKYRIADNIMLAFDFLEFTSENALDVFKNCSNAYK